jgi:hypothetical protein
MWRRQSCRPSRWWRNCCICTTDKSTYGHSTVCHSFVLHYSWYRRSI